MSASTKFPANPSNNSWDTLLKVLNQLTDRPTKEPMEVLMDPQGHMASVIKKQQADVRILHELKLFLFHHGHGTWTVI